MDYNYVRMRNAKKAGDDALAERYKQLYESGPQTVSKTDVLDYIIVLLGIVAIALGIYLHVSASDNSGSTAALYTSSICGEISA